MPTLMLLPCSGVPEELPLCPVCSAVAIGRVRGLSSATGSPLQGQGETGKAEARSRTLDMSLHLSESQCPLL